MFLYPIYNHNWRNISTIYIYIYITRLASNKIFSPSNKIHQEVSQAIIKMYGFSIIWLCSLQSMVYGNFAIVPWNWFQVHIEFRRQCLEMTVDKLLEQFVLNKYTGLEKPGKFIFLLYVSFFISPWPSQTWPQLPFDICVYVENCCSFDVCEMLLMYLVPDWVYQFERLVILGIRYEFFDLILWRYLLIDKMKQSSYTCAANRLWHCLLYMICCCCMINWYV
jgi:hypothetical protein